ncbi:MAG: RtcB family protein [Firmicutes bacterium]|nr:RtcB family protein [Bacillota bacterium]
MKRFRTKHNEEVVIYARTIEGKALEQIQTLSNSILGKGANIRIMPDAHAGAGCVIGTTMLILDKVCPAIVGVDIGCGVNLIKTNIDFKAKWQELDEIIKKFIPYGYRNHSRRVPYQPFNDLKCIMKLDNKTAESGHHALGTLGGGNHFIEAYEDGWLAVHSGSRGIGNKVALYYQNVAEKALLANRREGEGVGKELAYLEGVKMAEYLHDMKICTEFAEASRKKMLETIVSKMGGKISKEIISTHNYIDTKTNILRKGAIRANAGEELVIPLNMRDGILLCVGKGNPDWNNSAPHGAGRLMSRTKAKEEFKLEDFVKSMEGINTTTVSIKTLDEAPFAYKDWEEIQELSEPTVELVKHLRPVYNFKASE